MKIESYTMHRVTKPMKRPLVSSIYSATHLHNVILEIHAEGFTGIGYMFTYNRNHQDVICSMIRDYMDLLTGKRVEDVKRHWQTLYKSLASFGQSGAAVRAMCVVDTALWDLFSQGAKMPLYRFLGAYRDSISVYASGGWLNMSDRELVEEVQGAKERGFGAYKYKIGNDDNRRHERRTALLRKELGDDFELMVDANQSLGFKQAIDMGERLAALGVSWMEEPVDAHDLERNLALTQCSKIRIASGETLYLRAELKPFIYSHAADIIMPDLARCGGPTELMRIALMADAESIPVSSHFFTEVSCHLMAACPNTVILEYVEDWWEEFFSDYSPVVNGRIELSQTPGTGIRLNREALKFFATE